MKWLLFVLGMVCLSFAKRSKYDKLNFRTKLLDIDQYDQEKTYTWFSQKYFAEELKEQMKKTLKERRYNYEITYEMLKNLCREKDEDSTNDFFKMFDTNGDNVIGQPEFVDTFLTMKWGKTMKMFEVTRKLLQDHSPFIKAADRNKDKVLDRDEFNALLNPFCFDWMYSAVINQMLNYDRNADLVISKAELMAMYKIYKRSENFLKLIKLFDKYDANHNRVLDWTEMYEFQLAAFMSKEVPSLLLKPVLENAIESVYNRRNSDSDIRREL